MKKVNFHQFVHIEKGPVNSVVINFLDGNIYHINNSTIEEIRDSGICDYKEFIYMIKNGLLKKIDDKWIPMILSKQKDIKEDFVCNLEVEDELKSVYLDKLIKTVNIVRIFVYTRNKKEHKKGQYAGIDVIYRAKPNDCSKIRIISYPNIIKINESYYRFNMKYNSCWGKKLTLTNNGRLKPCLFSRTFINEINNVDPEELRKSVLNYWVQNKDKIPICQDCEFRYICFDCRVATNKDNGDIRGRPSACIYDPIKGKWQKQKTLI